VIPTALVPLCSYFISLNSDSTDVEFVDSTSIKSLPLMAKPYAVLITEKSVNPLFIW